MTERPKPPVRKRGTSLCRVCGERGHFTKTCEKYRGKVYNSWTVLRAAACPRDRAMSTYVRAECVCGVEKVVAVQHLKEGRSKSCGCSRSGMSTSGDDIPMPEVVTVYGAPMTLGELAALAGRKVEYVWARMRNGKTAEEAAFGRAVATPSITAPKAPKVLREDMDAQRAVGELLRWSERWARLAEHKRVAPVFSAIAAAAKEPA